jgi:Fic family protein
MGSTQRNIGSSRARVTPNRATHLKATRELESVSNLLNTVIQSRVITVQSILSLHKCYEFLEDDVEQGCYRTMSTVGSFRFYETYRCFLPPEEIIQGMDVFEVQVNEPDWSDSHGLLGAIARAYYAYAALVYYIHPFEDGNGRTARLLAVACLRMHGIRGLALTFKDKVLSLEEFVDRTLHHLSQTSVVGWTQ